MADKEGMDPLIQRALGVAGPTPTNPMEGLGSILSPNYGKGISMEPPSGAGAVVAPEVHEETVVAPRERKMSFLGQLLDGVNRAYGNPERYKEKFEKERLIDDMEGFTEDPVAAIKQVARHDPALAYKMYQTYVDDHRADSALQRQNNALDMRQNEYLMDRVGGMLNTATPENYGRLKPMIEKYIAARGLQMPFDLPEQYDEDAITAIRMGEVPVAKQIKMDDDRAYRNERLEDIDLNREATNSRFYTGQRNMDRRQGRTIAAADARAAANRSAVDRRQSERLATQGTSGIKEGTVQRSGNRLRRLEAGRWVMYTLKNGKPVRD